MSVLVVGMGGTIAMSGASGVVPTLSARQLVDAVPGLGELPLINSGRLLDPYKARLLLQLALLHGATRSQVAAAFAAAGGLGDADAWPWPR